MRQEVTMPRMGQSMEEGRLLRWLKQVGDRVERGESLAEIETDKAVLEMESFVAGTLAEVVTAEGDLVPTGTVIAFIEDGQPAGESPAPEPSPVPEQKPARIEESPAPATGRLNVSPVARRLAEEHGIDLAQLTGSGAGGRIGKEDVEAFLERRKDQPVPTTGRLNVSPVARRLAQEHGIDLTRVKGSGPAGRIGRADVEAWLESQDRATPAAGEARAGRVSLSKIKLTTARRMLESVTTAPHFYVSMDIELDRALEVRDWLKQQGHDVSINDLILKATTLALVRYPHLNAEFCDGELLLHPHIDLAVAVALDDGLITPVIHNCEKLSLVEISLAARGIAERARAGHLRQEDLDGGTFTVSNLGMYGVKQFEAVINPPQAAILAVGTVRRVAVFDDGDRLRPASLITATVSADHRVTDGAEVAGFLRQLRTELEGGFDLISCLT